MFATKTLNNIVSWISCPVSSVSLLSVFRNFRSSVTISLHGSFIGIVIFLPFNRYTITPKFVEVRRRVNQSRSRLEVSERPFLLRRVICNPVLHVCLHMHLHADMQSPRFGLSNELKRSPCLDIFPFQLEFTTSCIFPAFPTFFSSGSRSCCRGKGGQIITAPRTKLQPEVFSTRTLWSTQNHELLHYGWFYFVWLWQFSFIFAA